MCSLLATTTASTAAIADVEEAWKYIEPFVRVYVLLDLRAACQ